MESMRSAKWVSGMFMTWVSLADIWPIGSTLSPPKAASKIKEGGGGLLEIDLI